MKGPYEKDN